MQFDAQTMRVDMLRNVFIHISHISHTHTQRHQHQRKIYQFWTKVIYLFQFAPKWFQHTLNKFMAHFHLIAKHHQQHQQKQTDLNWTANTLTIQAVDLFSNPSHWSRLFGKLVFDGKTTKMVNLFSELIAFHMADVHQMIFYKPRQAQKRADGFTWPMAVLVCERAQGGGEKRMRKREDRKRRPTEFITSN